MPLAALGIIGAVGAIGGAAISANAAGNAAGQQVQAANYAANLQAQEANQSAQLQAGEYNNAQNLAAPFVQGGESAYANLENLLGILPQSVANTNLYQPNPLTVQPINYSGAQGTGTPQPQAQQPQGIPSQNLRPVFPGGHEINPANAEVGGTVNANGPVSYQNGYTSNLSNLGQVTANTNQQADISPTGTNPRALTNGSTTTPIGTAGTIGSTVNPALGATGSLMQGWNQTFQSPTAEQAAQMPGYQFQLKQGQDALQASAAAHGNLLSGNTAAALDQYSQGLASTDYNNLYNQSLQNYQTNFNTFEQNQANQYNRLASLAGLGQTQAQQLGSQGIQAGQNIGNTLLTAGNQIGNSAQNAAAAAASGYVGGANALSGGISGAANSLSSLALLNSLQNQQATNYGNALANANSGAPGYQI